jgi:hypothetical protein
LNDDTQLKQGSGVLDWRVLDLVDLVYDRGVNKPRPDPDAWKKWYPHPEAIGLVDRTQFPAKPQRPIHPLFPKFVFDYGTCFEPLNENPTFRDCLNAGRLSDLLLYGAFALSGPLHFILYKKYTRSGFLAGSIVGALSGSTLFFLSSSSTIQCQCNLIFSATAWIERSGQLVKLILHAWNLIQISSLLLVTIFRQITLLSLV